MSSDKIDTEILFRLAQIEKGQENLINELSNVYADNRITRDIALGNRKDITWIKDFREATEGRLWDILKSNAPQLGTLGGIIYLIIEFRNLL